MATYKEAAAAAAAELGRVEGEVLATARLATGLEARLRAALAGREAAETRAAAAARAAVDVRGPAARAGAFVLAAGEGCRGRPRLAAAQAGRAEPLGPFLLARSCGWARRARACGRGAGPLGARCGQ